MDQQKQPSPSATLSRLLLGNRVQQAIHVAAKLGLADLVTTGPRSIAELAQSVDADPDGLYRLMRTLSTYGIFCELPARRFTSTPIADLLRSGTRESKRAFALWSGDVSYQLFGALEHSVRTGRPAFDELFGMNFFDYLTCFPETGKLFDAFMSRQTAPMGSVVAARDIPPGSTVVDVGGGRGELLTAVLAAHPTAHGILLDQSHVLNEAAENLRSAEVADRSTILEGNYLQAVPQGDLYLLKNIVHGLGEADAIQVLSNCRDAMRTGGRLLLIEFVIGEPNKPSPGYLMDLLMLVGSHGGRERTEPEFVGLLAGAGLELTDIQQTQYAFCLIEAKPGATA
jgi:cyclopropane fatty-acyl-phospholipid synthase-like methyltransferase